MALLREWKAEIDWETEAYLDRVIKEISKKDALMTEALKYVKNIALCGGKRLRGAYMCAGYLAAGGKDVKRIIKTSVSVELIHVFLLIHDDIIDRDLKRHNLDSVHARYEKLGRKFLAPEEAKHFGESMALIIGNMVGALGNQVIFQSGFEAKKIMKALDELQSVVSWTVVGEAQDIFFQTRKQATEAEVIKMYENKTARYTVDGPLKLGAILGGADEKLIEFLHRYASTVGVAFQIKDDILGIFGNERKLGKSVGADITEGKFTLLLAKALELANSQEKKRLRLLLGKKDISKKEIEEVQIIMKRTGALEYAENKAKALVAEGIKAIEMASVNKKIKNFLKEVAQYMVDRNL